MTTGYGILLVSLAFGYVLARLPFFPQSRASFFLNVFVINVALPSTVLLSIRNIAFSPDLIIPIAVQWISLLLAAMVVMFVSRRFSFSKLTTGTLLVVVPLGNTAFLGLSVIPAFFGQAGVPYGVMYDQLGSFLALATYGAAVAGAYGRGDTGGVKSSLLRIISFPPFIFLILGFVIQDIALPAWLHTFLTLLSKTLVPAAMIAIGLHMSLRVTRHLLRPLVGALSIRLLLVPLCLLAAVSITGFNGLAVQVSIFQAAMPSMITAAVLASDRGLDASLATSIVGIGLLASLVTLPVMHVLINLAA